jgi:hypothetical protein
MSVKHYDDFLGMLDIDKTNAQELGKNSLVGSYLIQLIDLLL